MSFSSVYSTKDLLEISDRIDKDFPEGRVTTAFEDLQIDFDDMKSQIIVQNNIIRILSSRVKRLEDSLPLIGI